MATASVPYSNFVNGSEVADGDKVDANYQALVDFLNASVVHRDGSKSFTSLVSLPTDTPGASNPIRKDYLDTRLSTAGWTAFTPTWTASTPPTIGNGVLAGRYMKIGRKVTVNITITIGSTTTLGTGNYNFGTPDTIAANTAGRGICGGTGVASDVSAVAITPLTVSSSGGSTVGAINTAGAYVGPASPYAWATGDSIDLFFEYESSTG